MDCSKRKWPLLCVGFLNIAVVIVGLGIGSLALVALGALGSCYALGVCYRRRGPKRRKRASARREPVVHSLPMASAPKQAVPQDDKEGLVHDLLTQGRYALLLRPQIIDNLDAALKRRTIEELDDEMALVPAGEVVLEPVSQQTDDTTWEGEEGETPQGRVVYLEPVLLDRHPITNAQYQRFVDGGGYEEMSIWDEDIWGAMLDFVDETGYPGPRYWRNGKHARDKAEHPVTGVSWYEAVAYARWSGKRLPTDAEWTKAGCWPVAMSPGNWQQRRYPWGESLEADRANLWDAGIGDTVPIDKFEDGLSVGGLQQMIGNVWEWTSTAYGSPDDASLALPMPMKSLRGGAFDTYFENQATCHFQSGDNPLSRKHNIGFRLALGVCDLAPEAAHLVYGSAENEPLPVAAEA